jgi:hypothetical protein
MKILNSTVSETDAPLFIAWPIFQGTVELHCVQDNEDAARDIDDEPKFAGALKRTLRERRSIHYR